MPTVELNTVELVQPTSIERDYFIAVVFSDILLCLQWKASKIVCTFTKGVHWDILNNCQFGSARSTWKYNNDWLENLIKGFRLVISVWQLIFVRMTSESHKEDKLYRFLPLTTCCSLWTWCNVCWELEFTNHNSEWLM